MKYFNVNGINRAIALIREGDNTQEHVTSRATFGMINHYFKQSDNWYVVPEKAQVSIKNGRRPDYAIEKFDEASGEFLSHAYVEVKSLVNSSIGGILNQVSDTILMSVDSQVDGFSCFVIAMKGTKIAFYTYHSFITLLDQYGVDHYEGLIPVNYTIPISTYSNINKEATPQMWENYMNSHGSFTTNPVALYELGATNTKGLSRPHILDLVNEKHKNDIHNMWKFVVENSANIFT